MDMDSRRGWRFYSDPHDPRSHGYLDERSTNYSGYVRYDEREPYEALREYDSWYGLSREEMYSNREDPVYAQGSSYGRYYHECHDIERFQRPQYGPERGTQHSRPIPGRLSHPEDRLGQYTAQNAEITRQIPTIHGRGQHMSPKNRKNMQGSPRRPNQTSPWRSQMTREQKSGPVSAESPLSSPRQQLNKSHKDQIHGNSRSPLVRQPSGPWSEAGNTGAKQSVVGKAGAQQFGPNSQGRSSTTANELSGGSQISGPELEKGEHSSLKYQVNFSPNRGTAITVKSLSSRNSESQQSATETHESLSTKSNAEVCSKSLLGSEGNQSPCGEAILRKKTGSRIQDNKLSNFETKYSGSPSSRFSEKLSTPGNTGCPEIKHQSSQSEDLSKVENVPGYKVQMLVTRAKDNSSLCSHSDFNTKAGQNRPKVLVEVELVSKLKDINLSTNNEGLGESKDKFEKGVAETLQDQDANESARQEGGNYSFDGNGSDGSNMVSSNDKIKIDFDKLNSKKDVEKEIAERIDKTISIDKKELELESKSVRTEMFTSSVYDSNKAVSNHGVQNVERALYGDIGSEPNILSVSSLSANDIENEEDSISKSNATDKDNKENGTNQVKHESKNSSGEGNETGQVKLSAVSALQKKVLEKLRKKTSLVKQVNDRSLRLLTKGKTVDSQYSQNITSESLDITGSCEDMSDMNDTAMEVDSSFDTYSGNDSLNVKPVHNMSCSSYTSTSNWTTEDSSFADQSLNVTSETEVHASSEQLKTVEVFPNDASGCTEEGNNIEDKENVHNKLGGISNKVADTEYGNVERDTSTGSCLLGTEGPAGNIDDSTEMYTSTETSLEGIIDNQNMIDDQNEPCDEIATEAVATDEGIEDSRDAQLRKKFNIREVSVTLGKIDVPGRVKDSVQEMIDEVDKPDKQRDDKQFDTKCKEAVTDSCGLEIDLPKEDQVNDCLEKKLVSGKSYQRPVVPLNERFSQLSQKYSETETEIDADEGIYKAEFENIVNKLKNKSELNGQTGGEDMEVEHGSDDHVTNESEVRENSQEINIDVKYDKDERDEKNENGHTNPVQDGNFEQSLKENEERQVSKDAKLDASSPVSFLDYSDESDDELLRTPSAFLRSIEEINGRPVVITPTKVIDSSQNSTATTSSSDLSPVKPIAQRPGVKNKFTLDGLLADHEEKADLVKEMDEINQELQDEIRQGGFVNILNREDAATDLHITEEQKEMLKQFEVEESRICEDRPGVIVFQPQHYKCLFSSMLHPTHCGFTVGSNGLQLERHLESLTPTQYKRVITSGIITQCFTRISCQTPLLRWLFFIMSVHDDYQIQQGCKKILLEVLHFQHIYGSQKWAPRLIDVLSVLVNYGADLESLVPCGSNTVEIIRGKLMHEPNYIHQPVQHNEGVNAENLILVLQILAQCLHGPSGRYSPNDLSLLCVALCKASLDTSLKNMCAKGAFQNCITMVIRQYIETDWLKERLKLTRMLVSITDHHHNSAHIAELLPPGQRGTFLQRRFCYLVLSDVLFDRTNVSDEVLNSVQIQDLKVFVSKMEELLEIDTYKMSSVVTLIDLCVGVQITMNSEQRDQLKSLLEQVRRVRVRDNVRMLDRTRVKDMIVRMTSKWALDIQTMKGKQTKIFEYASPMKMFIEPVNTLQSSGEEEEHSDSDNDLPSKKQKLEQT